MGGAWSGGSGAIEIGSLALGDMDAPILILVGLFVLFLALNVPVAVSIALASFGATWASAGSFDLAAKTIAQKMATGIDSFTLLAIPFFILSGNLMGRGGIARRLMDFASALVGHFSGGLGHVNVVTCMLFGSLSGSATAAVSSVGGFMIPEMNRKRYELNFNVAVTTTAATTGLIIPPSNIMIVYALVSGGTVSIATLFVAGIIPGVVMGCSLMLVIWFVSLRAGYRGNDRVAWKEVLRRFRRAFLSLLLVVIVLGGILNGIFTATEAAAISVLYAGCLSLLVYREIRWRELPTILIHSGNTTAVVFLLIAASTAMSWVLTIENIPQSVSAALLSVTDHPIGILLLINLLLLLVGAFMDMTPAVLIFTPILWPVCETIGMNPVHFGILLITNLCIGLCTPPVGTCLFVGCGVGKTNLAAVLPKLLPFYLAMVVALLLITFVPALSLALPSWLGMNP